MIQSPSDLDQIILRIGRTDLNLWRSSPLKLFFTMVWWTTLIICLLHVKSIYSYSHSSALRLVHYGYGSKWLCQAARLESGVLVLLHVKSPYSSAYSGALHLVHRARRGRV